MSSSESGLVLIRVFEFGVEVQGLGLSGFKSPGLAMGQGMRRLRDSGLWA